MFDGTGGGSNNGPQSRTRRDILATEENFENEIGEKGRRKKLDKKKYSKTKNGEEKVAEVRVTRFSVI